MSYINLLPPQEFQKRKEERTFRLILINGFLLTFLLTFFFLVISVLNIKANNMLLKEEEKLSSKRIEIFQAETLQKKISFVNSTFKKINKFYSSQIFTTDVINLFLTCLKSGMTIQSFNFSPETGRGYLLGYAPSLETLEEYRNEIKAKKELSDVEIEVLGYLKTKDINFRLDFVYGDKNKE